MRTALIAVTTAIAIALGRADAATAKLATDGYAFDGKTTYCEGVREAKAPLQFNQELATSVGKCPLSLELTTTVRKGATSNTIEVWVDWSASLASGDVAQSLFPRVVDATSGSPKPIIASLVRACKSGSNCATDADVVVPAVIKKDATATGPFDDDNRKALGSFVFGFPSGQVDHIVIAKIVLPGDPQLNISAIEFLTFQRVQSPGDAAVPATVKPFDRDTKRAIQRGTPVLTPMPSHLSSIHVNATGTDTGFGTAKPTTGRKSDIILLSAIGGLACVVAIAYFAVFKREKNAPPPLDDGHDVIAGVYRLTDAPKRELSVQISVPPHQKRMARAKPWAVPPSNDSSVEHNREAAAPANRTLSIGSYSDFTARQLLMRDSRVSSAHSSHSSSCSLDVSMVVSETMSFSSLHNSEAGDLSSFNRVDDSPAEWPVACQRHRSTSTFTTLDELEHDLSFEEDEPRSSASDNDLLTTESALAWSQSVLRDASDHEGCDVDLLTTESRLSWLSDMSDHEA